MFLRNYPCLQTQTWYLNSINLVFQVCADQNLFLSCGKRHPNPLRRHFTGLFLFFSFRLNSPTVQINHFKVNNSVAFSTFIMLYNHHLCSKRVPSPQKETHTHSAATSRSPLPPICGNSRSASCLCGSAYSEYVT